jgi:chromosome segregation ATPase
MRLLRLCAAGALAFTVSGTATLAADTPGEARLRDALRTTTSQLRTLEEEQARWAGKEAQLKKELEAARAEAVVARKGAVAAGEGRALKQKLAEQQEAVAKTTEALTQCQRQVDEEGAKARKLEEVRSEVTGQLDGLTSRVAACEAKNSRMVTAGQDFATWLARPGMVCEPVFGLRRVTLENRTQEFLDKLLDQKAGR